MNIWMLNHYAGAPTDPSTRHFDLARELVARGHDVTIVAAGFSHLNRKENQKYGSKWWSGQTVDGVKYAWIKTFPYQGNDWRRVVNMLSYTIGAFSLGTVGLKRPDVIVGSSVHPLAVVSALALSKIHRCRFVFEVRDLWPQTLVDMGALAEDGWTTKSLRALEGFLYKQADHIVVLLPTADRYIARWGIARSRISWIPNGVDLSRYRDLPPYDGGGNSAFNIYYMGAHGDANALDNILKAADILLKRDEQRPKFIFVGDGPAKPRLIEMARSMSLRNVEFVDRVPKSDVPALMGQASALVFNLDRVKVFQYGISSNKLYDYLVSGRPVLFCGEAGNNPVEESGAGISVPPRDPEALANAVIRMANMTPEARKAMGAKGPDWVRKNHDIAHLAELMERAVGPNPIGNLK